MARTTASARTRRILAALHMLAERKRIPLDELAKTLGASPSEVEEDLSLLSFCGVAPYDPWALAPVSVEDGWVEVWGEMPALDDAVRLSAAEARALAAALQYAGMEHDDPLVARLLEAAASTDLEGRRDLDRVLRTASEHPSSAEIMKSASLALSDGRVLTIEYAGAGDHAPRSRAVEPLQLLCERGVWYLHAFCRTAEAPRTFRLDRISSAVVSDEHAPVRDIAPSGGSLVAEGLPIATLRFESERDFDEREWPFARVSRSDGALVVEVPFAGTEWIRRQVAAHMGAVEVLAPAEVRDAVASFAGAFARSLR